MTTFDKGFQWNDYYIGFLLFTLAGWMILIPLRSILGLMAAMFGIECLIEVESNVWKSYFHFSFLKCCKRHFFIPLTSGRFWCHHGRFLQIPPKRWAFDVSLLIGHPWISWLDEPNVRSDRLNVESMSMISFAWFWFFAIVFVLFLLRRSTARGPAQPSRYDWNKAWKKRTPKNKSKHILSFRLKSKTSLVLLEEKV